MSKFANAKEYSETMQEWGYALADLSPEQVKRGIEQSIKLSAWPPEIAEFIAFAKSAGDWQHGGAAYRTHVRALPKPRNVDVAKSAIAGLRAAL